MSVWVGECMRERGWAWVAGWLVGWLVGWLPGLHPAAIVHAKMDTHRSNRFTCPAFVRHALGRIPSCLEANSYAFVFR